MRGRRCWVPRESWVLGRSRRFSCLRPPFMASVEDEEYGTGLASLCHSFCLRLSSPPLSKSLSSAVLSFAQFTWCEFQLLGIDLGGGRRGACKLPPMCGQQTGKTVKMYAAIVYIACMRVWLNKKNELIRKLFTQEM